jgi:hypothetical protein
VVFIRISVVVIMIYVVVNACENVCLHVNGECASACMWMESVYLHVCACV